MTEVSTSLLNMKENQEAETIFGLEKARTDYIHIDVMDGKFVEKDTYQKMYENASYTKRISNLPLDVHLMIEDVEKGIEEYINIVLYILYILYIYYFYYYYNIQYILSIIIIYIYTIYYIYKHYTAKKSHSKKQYR